MMAADDPVVVAMSPPGRWFLYLDISSLESLMLVGILRNMSAVDDDDFSRIGSDEKDQVSSLKPFPLLIHFPSLFSSADSLLF